MNCKSTIPPLVPALALTLAALGIPAIAAPAAKGSVVPPVVDLKTATKDFQSAGRDRKTPIAEVSNAYVRVLSATNLTDETRLDVSIDFGRFHAQRSLIADAVNCFESVAADKKATPKIRLRALNEAGKTLRDANFRGAFATYRHEELDQAAAFYLRAAEVEGATAPEKVEALKRAAYAKLDANQEVLPEAEALLVKATKLPELSEEERARAEMNLADYYIDSLAPEKARAIVARLAPVSVEKKFHVHLRRRILGTYGELIAKLDGFDKALPMVTEGMLSEAFDRRRLARFCQENGRPEKAIEFLRQAIPGAEAKPSERIRYMRDQLCNPYGQLGLDMLRGFVEKDVVPLLRDHPDEWKPFLDSLNARGFRYCLAAKSSGYDRWLLSLAARAPAGKGLSSADFLDLACQCGDTETSVSCAWDILKEGDPKSKGYRKAAIVAAVIEARDGKTAVRKVRNALDKADVKDPKARGESTLEAARLAMAFRDDERARALFRDYEKMIVPTERPTLECRFIADAPGDISSIMASDFYRKAQKGKLDKKYGEHLQFLLDTDAAVTGRKIVEGKDGVPVPELFVFCDLSGVKFLINAFMSKEEIAALKSGFGGAAGYEAYLVPGIDCPYEFLYLEPPANYVDVDGGFRTQYDNGNGHRNLSVSGNTIDVSYLVRGDSVVTLISVDWAPYFDSLPTEGSEWFFEPIIWSRGGLSWGGSESVHNRSSFGRVVFKDLTPANRTAIKRRLLNGALRNYRRAKSARGNGQIEIWKDNELGDQDFYDRRVKPLCDRLDPYEKLVKESMTDEEVELVYEKAARTWYNIDYVVWQLRRDYLDEKFTSEE